MVWDDVVDHAGRSTRQEHVADARNDNRTNLLIAEYTAIRAVEAQKSSASHALVGAYLTVVAVILGFVVANRADPRLLITVPILSAVCGTTILRRRRDREVAHRYVREILRPIAVQCSGDDRIFLWEEFYARHKDARSMRYEFGLQLVFPLSAAAALVATLPLLASFGDWLAWLAGLSFLVMLIVTYLHQNRKHLGRIAGGVRVACRTVVRWRRGRKPGSGFAADQ
ncbi:hypothetical protein NLX85_05945 [Micromonospora sp. A3M-1-15]|uniref:hypothetical protein n=1 Tax=Micromonospora sp. A3M-1-15 TaxID=2962035 RepID=UPI0020B70AF0|nr:hypothetical protein [Micromonospora sp. A3M-1-15]MCP3782906.1 hypothetical protein [Micromonospora sp. A3M-1-15]